MKLHAVVLSLVVLACKAAAPAPRASVQQPQADAATPSAARQREWSAGQQAFRCYYALGWDTHTLASRIALARRISEDEAACVAEAALVTCNAENPMPQALSPYIRSDKACQYTSALAGMRAAERKALAPKSDSEW